VRDGFGGVVFVVVDDADDEVGDGRVANGFVGFVDIVDAVDVVDVVDTVDVVDVFDLVDDVDEVTLDDRCCPGDAPARAVNRC
jgi:hypothetical protein